MAAFKLYTEAPWRPETQGFIPSWWQGRSANLQTTTLSRCTVQNKHHQKSAWFASACPNLISANQSYHVWNARHCFKLYDIFCALWVSKFTWFQHWEKEILRIMFLLLGNDARLGEDAHGALPVEPWCYGWPGKAKRFEMIMFNFKDSNILRTFHNLSSVNIFIFSCRSSTITMQCVFAPANSYTVETGVLRRCQSHAGSVVCGRGMSRNVFWHNICILIYIILYYNIYNIWDIILFIYVFIHTYIHVFIVLSSPLKCAK